MLSLKDKVALVTGCGTIGRAGATARRSPCCSPARALGSSAVDLDLEAAEATPAHDRGRGRDGRRCALRRHRAGDVKALVDDCLARFGRIDILVNNVGRSEPGDPVRWTRRFGTTRSRQRQVGVSLLQARPAGDGTPGRRLDRQRLLDRRVALCRQAAGRLQRRQGGADPTDRYDGGDLCRQRAFG